MQLVYGCGCSGCRCAKDPWRDWSIKYDAVALERGVDNSLLIYRLLERDTDSGVGKNRVMVLIEEYSEDARQGRNDDRDVISFEIIQLRRRDSCDSVDLMHDECS